MKPLRLMRQTVLAGAASVLSGAGLAADAPPPGINHAPVVTAHFGGSRTFLWDKTPLAYQIVVSDAEDGDTLGGGSSSTRACTPT